MSHKKIRKNITKKSRILLNVLGIIIGFLGILLFASERWMRKTWPNLNVQELIYQLKAPIAGTSKDLLMSYVTSSLLLAVIALLALILASLLLYKKRMAKAVYSLVCILLGGTLSFYSIYDVWASLDLDGYLESQSTYSTIVEDHYVDPSSARLKFPDQKRNLIYLYLESMESTYADTASGGAFSQNYIPELTELAAQNTSFSNSDLLGGAYPTVYTTWTMGGIFAQTSGLPLNTSVGANDMADQDSFFPELTTLGDVLEKEGYQQYFMIGSNGSFGGRENYVKEHGNYEMDDYNWALEQGLIPEGYYVWWGYEDEKLFSFAKNRLTEIAAKGQPFNFTMLTADTHFEDGYPCELCDKETYGDDQYGMVIRCSSKQVTEFVSWIQQQNFYENTTIVISGDHLTMDTDFCANVPDSYQRSVYNVIINPAVTPQKEKKRTFTTMDMFPTTLASLGVEIEGNRLGLGTNLFSDQQTLAEEIGFDELNRQLSERSKFFETLDEGLQKSAWEQTDQGWKFYIRDENRYAKGEWVTNNPHRYKDDTDQKYYIDENGYAVSGWYQIDGKWYYFAKFSNRLLEGPCDEPFDLDESQYK